MGTWGIGAATGGGVSSASSGDDSGSFFTEAKDEDEDEGEVESDRTVLGPCRLLMALFWYVFSTFLRCGVYGCGGLDTSIAPLGSFSIIVRLESDDGPRRLRKSARRFGRSKWRLRKSIRSYSTYLTAPTDTGAHRNQNTSEITSTPRNSTPGEQFSKSRALANSTSPNETWKT